MTNRSETSKPAKPDFDCRTYFLLGVTDANQNCPSLQVVMDHWQHAPTKKDCSAAAIKWRTRGYCFARLAVCSVVGLFAEEDLIV